MDYVIQIRRFFQDLERLSIHSNYAQEKLIQFLKMYLYKSGSSTMMVIRSNAEQPGESSKKFVLPALSSELIILYKKLTYTCVLSILFPLRTAVFRESV